MSSSTLVDAAHAITPTATAETPAAGAGTSLGAAHPATHSVVAERVAGSGLVLVAILLIALNLRTAVTSLGALLEDVTDGIGFSAGLAGVITMLPAISFAAFGALTPRLTRRLGATRLLLIAMALLAVGEAVRALTGSLVVFVATSALALAGIAVSNVLLPSVVKRYFPHKVGLVTGIYSMTLTAGSALAAATSVPVANAAGSWRAGLGIWALLAAVAIVPLALMHRAAAADRARSATSQPAPNAVTAAVPGRFVGPGHTVVLGHTVVPGHTVAPGRTVAGATSPQAAVRGAIAAAGAAPNPDPSVVVGGVAVGRAAPGSDPAVKIRPSRTRLGWAMALFFGAQSFGAYAVMGWLAQLFRDAGFSAEASGLLLATVMAIGIPIALVMPAIAARLPDQRILVAVLTAASVASYLGLLFAPRSGAVAWTVLLAIGQSSFPLVLVLLGMRARTAAGTVALSAFAQSTGYLIAAAGPLLIGLLYEVTGAWVAPLAVLLGALVVQATAGAVAARPGTLEDELDSNSEISG